MVSGDIVEIEEDLLVVEAFVDLELIQSCLLTWGILHASEIAYDCKMPDLEASVVVNSDSVDTEAYDVAFVLCLAAAADA